MKSGNQFQEEVITDNFIKRQVTWHASWPLSPPAQKLDAGKMKIFSVTVLIFLTHSLSFTIGTRASRILRGMGPAENLDIKLTHFILTDI